MALKFLQAHVVATGQSQRSRVISLMPGYHGATLQTIDLNGDVTAPFLCGDLTVYSEKIPAPLTFRPKHAGCGVEQPGRSRGNSCPPR